MNFRFNLRDLEYLVALDEEGHFHRAAQRCFVSQPTLSGQIKKLEESLGVALVERSSRQVCMTEAGREVAAQARRVLAEARVVNEVATAFRDPLAGRLQAGVIPTVAPYLLRLFISPLQQRLPELRLFLHEHQTAVLLEKLRRAGSAHPGPAGERGGSDTVGALPRAVPARGVGPPCPSMQAAGRPGGPAR